MAIQFLVTSVQDAIDNLAIHYKSMPVAAGRNVLTDTRTFYVKGKRAVMSPTGTQTANGTKQYLVKVE